MQYPTKKIIACFTLSPALPAPFISAFMVMHDEASLLKALEWYYWLPTYLGVTLWVSLCAVIFYGVPSLMLAAGFATLRLRRCAKHMLFVSLAGGATAFLFNGLFLPPLFEFAAFILGLVTSLLAALFALPKQTTPVSG